MIFGEGKAKDAYRRLVWGPGQHGLDMLPVPWEHRAVRLLGRTMTHTARRKNKEVVNNLRRAFPNGNVPDGRPIEQVAADAFASHFANQYIGFSFRKCDVRTWPSYLGWHGLELLESYRRAGRGVVVVHPHMGPAQLPLHVLGQLGWPVTQVGGGEVTRVALSEVGTWAASVRAKLESHMPVQIHDGKSFLRPLLRRLENGEVVLTAGDGTGGGHELGRRLNRSVLGHTMAIPVSPVWLAAKTGAALLTVHCYRNPGDGPLYIAEVGDEIPLDRDQNIDGILEDGVDHIASWLDRVLRTHPGDWLFWD
ncbi:MAG: lysophospholipid acyltransferase family protein, partial [Myxococcota bacterium]